MTAGLTLALACAACLMALAPARAAASPADDRAADVSRLAQSRAVAAASKASVATAYERQIGEISALKRRRPSWRRDRELKARSADAQATAARLQRLDREARELDARLGQARWELVRAIDRELADPTLAAVRFAELGALRARTRAALAPPVRKIVLPDDAIDPLADADELGDQAALMARAEQELAREERSLAAREDRYRKMAKLQEKRGRADELALLDDDDPRRSTGRTAGARAGADGASDGPTGPSPPSESDDAGGGGAGGEGAGGDPGPSPDPASEADPVIVLADVVQPDTLTALRRAERSDDPAVKAAATARARLEVARKRQRLEAQRQRIRDRIRALRGGP